MALTYLILAHSNPKIFGELVAALGGARVIVHLDARADTEEFESVTALHSNMTFVSPRCVVRWGGWSMVRATLALMAEAVGDMGPGDWAVLLSGDSFPTQPPDCIARFLDANPEAQYMDVIPMPSVTHDKPLTRISRLHLPAGRGRGAGGLVPRLVNKIGIPRDYKGALAGRQPFCGSQWWVLT